MGLEVNLYKSTVMTSGGDAEVLRERTVSPVISGQVHALSLSAQIALPSL